MDWKRIGRIRLEDILDAAIRRFFVPMICALSALVILGLCGAMLGLPTAKDGRRRAAPGLGLAGIAVLWTYRVWSRKSLLKQKALARPRRPASAARPAPPLNLLDFEPPEKEEWAGGHFEFSRGVDLADRWLWTVVSLVVAGLFGYAFLAGPTMTEGTSLLHRLGMACLLAVVPVSCLAWAMAGTIRYRRTGVSSFQMDPVPAQLGERVGGVITLPAALRLKESLEIELVCVRQSSEGDFTLERTLHQTEAPPLRSDATLRSRLAIPVSIHIPRDALPTRREESAECIRWVLVVKARRARYQAEFEIPIVASI